MDKQELKTQYHLKKISAKEYFLKLGEIMRLEMIASSPASPVPGKYDDLLAIFDGKLPIFDGQA